jgi:hypothetical protein
MQVKNINISHVSKSQAIKAKSGPTGFARIFYSSMAGSNPNKNEAGTASIPQHRNRYDKTGIIKLDNISPAQPKVSHLSIRHPEYGQECWKIIHSDLNKDKPYTQIPDGTNEFTIFNPVSNHFIPKLTKNYLFRS